MVTFGHDPYNAIRIHSKAKLLIKMSLQETYKSILSKSMTKCDVSMQKINLRQNIWYLNEIGDVIAKVMISHCQTSNH